MDQASLRVAKLEEVLRQVPYQYQNKERLRQDVSALLRTCSTLTPQTGTFAGQGRQVTLFHLYGVLPITYNGATYNIPVTMYFDPPYPKQPPRCFVTPTSGMELKKSHPHVDQGGMIYIPYLSSWNERSSSLTELVTFLKSIFSIQPPVHSTAAGSRPAAAAKAPPIVQAVPVAAHVVAQPVTPVLVSRSAKEGLVQSATQKLESRWRSVLGPLVADVNVQLEQRVELEAGAKKVNEAIVDLQAELERKAQQQKDLVVVETKLRAFIEANAGREPDPDDLRNSADPDTQQVLDCLAEEIALEELLMALDELLDARKISIEDFLREVRDVARRKFLCQVQRQKAAASVAASSGGVAAAVPVFPAFGGERQAVAA